jgi:uncharacterized protein (TIGR04255 family)
MHYRNSPITEAIIDIRVDVASDFKVEMLDPVYDLIRADYPNREEVMFFQGQFMMRPDVAPSASQTKQGYLYRSNDEKYVLQTRVNGFTLSRLPPYENWDSFRNMAKKLWDIYKSIAQPVRASRVAIRSINRIDIPPFTELKDYFKTFPEVSPDLPQKISGYVMQLLIPQEDFGGTLSLIQAIVPPPRREVVSISLDIDLYKEFKDEFDSDDEIWSFLEFLRARKNLIFEGCITDTTRNLFGPILE